MTKLSEKIELAKKKFDEKPVVFLKKPTEKKSKKPKKILGDKDLNRKQMIPYLQDYLKENQANFTLDWLRGMKLTFESVNEMRKQTKRKVIDKNV